MDSPEGTGVSQPFHMISMGIHELHSCGTAGAPSTGSVRKGIGDGIGGVLSRLRWGRRRGCS